MEVTAGTLILWVGWFYFNGGSATTMYAARYNSVSRIIMNTIIAAGSGAITHAYLKPLCFRSYSKYAKHDFFATCDGVICGLVAITASCNNVETWAAFVICIVSSPVCIAGLYVVKAMGIDNPINASAIHTSNGIWGLIVVGIFDNTKGFVSGNRAEMGKFFGFQVCGMIIILAWTFFLNLVFFLTMKKLKVMRVPLVCEIIGCDYTECGKPFPRFLTEKTKRITET